MAADLTGSAARWACRAVVWTWVWPTSSPIMGRHLPKDTAAGRRTGIVGVGLALTMAEEPADHRQAVPEGEDARGEGMPNILGRL